MKIEHVKGEIRYTLSNDNLKVGDETYSIANGRCIGNRDWILHDLDFKGFEEDEIHIIEDLNYSTYQPYRIRTDRGFGPPAKYYKIIKREKRDTPGTFGHSDWVEIKENE